MYKHFCSISAHCCYSTVTSRPIFTHGNIRQNHVTKCLYFVLSRGAEVSDCGRYLLITPMEGCAPVNRLFYCDLQQLGNAGITGECTHEQFPHPPLPLAHTPTALQADTRETGDYQALARTNRLMDWVEAWTQAFSFCHPVPLVPFPCLFPSSAITETGYSHGCFHETSSDCCIAKRCVGRLSYELTLLEHMVSVPLEETAHCRFWINHFFILQSQPCFPFTLAWRLSYLLSARKLTHIFFSAIFISRKTPLYKSGRQFWRWIRSKEPGRPYNLAIRFRDQILEAVGRCENLGRQWRLVYTYDASTSISTNTSISHVWTRTMQAQAQACVPFSCACACVVPVNSHVANACADACACVVRVNQPCSCETKSFYVYRLGHLNPHPYFLSHDLSSSPMKEPSSHSRQTWTPRGTSW